MPDLSVEMGRRPEEAGVSSERLARALKLLDQWVELGKAPGVAAVVFRRGMVLARHFRGVAGEAKGEPPVPIGPETIFPMASLTKPIATTAFMLLVEAGEVTFDDSVARFVPEFGKLGKEQVRVRHLLAHTSGLPDMVPNNEALRKAHQSLPSFVRSACRAELGFTPGTRVAYGSTDTLMLSEIVTRVTGQTFADFAAERVFEPLGLESTFFAPPESLYPRIARLRLPDGRAATSWDNNSPYWRQLGAPWGGLFATADDTARFARYFLEAYGGPSRSASQELILAPATARLMVQNHTRGIPSSSGAPEAWGLGWALPSGQPTRWAGDLASAETFGHTGANGAMLWVDPQRELACVVLSNRITNWATDYRRFAVFSNALQAAVVG